MKAGWRIVVVFLLLLGVVQAAVVDEKVVQELQNNPDVGVIVTLKDTNEQSKGINAKISEKDNNEKRAGLGLSSLAQNNREEVLGKLKLKEKKDNIGNKDNTIRSKLKLGLSSDDYDLELKHKYSIINGFSGKITKEGLEKLRNNPNVEKIYFNNILHPTLTTSIPQINVDDVWNITINNQRINGAGETICIPDTGIDTDHTAFAGRILNQHCYCQVSDYGAGGCCPNNTTEDISAEDGQGHGTHVAGIAASGNETYRGVAPNAGIVSIKVCNNAGEASCNTDDVIAGIQWCVNNATRYNISVISISLGGGGPYNSYCNNDVIAPVINSAVGQNISVMIAAGNSGWINGISSPACVQNATAIGAVSSSDVIKYNRGLLLSLLAPSDVTSSVPGGGFSYKSGTSMSTPHVSGAAVLLQQYNKMIHGSGLTPAEVRTTLNTTGKAISDAGGSGLNFSRINVYNALLSLDDVSPAISFISPDNGSAFNLSVTINISSNEPLQNVLLEWNGTNESMSGSGTSFYKTKVSNISGDYSFRVYGWDLANNSNVTELRVVTLQQEIIAPVLTILSPGNNTLQNYSFTINVSSDKSLDRAVLEWNGTNETMLGSGISFYVTKTNLLSGVYSFRVYGWDLANNTNVSELREITINSSPALTVVKPSSGEVFGGGFSLNATLSSQYNLSSSNYNISNSSGVSVQYNNSAIMGTTFTWRDYVNVSNSTFNDGNYTLVVFGNDTVGNSVESNVTFNVDKTAPVIYGVNRSVDVVHNNDSVVIFVNVSDVHVNTSSVYLESNFSGSLRNHSMNFEGGERYNFTVNSGNLSNQELILYHFWATDIVGNTNVSVYYNFTVQNTVPVVLSVNISSSDSLNLTNGTLTGSWSATDIDGDVIYNETRWYNNSVEVTALINSTSVGLGNTTKNENWTFSLRVYDGLNYSALVNSSSLTIVNAAPLFNQSLSTQTINSLASLSYQINCSDLDVDTITYYDTTPLFNINSTSGLITDSPAESEVGSYIITITCGDGTTNISGAFNYTITDGASPTSSGAVNTSANFFRYQNFTANITFTEGIQLDAYIFSTNATGSWVNVTTDISGINYNASNAANITVAQGTQVCWYYWVNDTAGNFNQTSMYCFTVQNRGLSSLSITFPGDGSVVEVGNSSAFNATAIDPDGDSLTYSWNFSDGNITTGKDVTHTFNVAGNFTVILTVSELLTSNTTNISVFVNDTIMPTVSNVTYDTEVHLSQDINQSITASFFDYSGIASATLLFDNSLKTANCSDTSTTTKVCTWSWGNFSEGSYNFTINVTDNFTTAHTNSSVYSFTVVSCSDGIKNGDETGTDCGGSCSACSSSPSSSSSSGGGGGGPPKTVLGATETPPTTPTTPTTPATPITPVTSETTTGSENEIPIATVPATISEFTQSVTLDTEKETVITVDKSSVAVKELKLSSKVGKEVQVFIKSLEQKPAEITEVPGTYQYLQIEVQLDQKEIDEALVTFTVPNSWLEENKYSAESVVLQRYAEGVWGTLDTEVLSKGESEVTYQATLDHFSYFAIVGGVEKPREIPWLKLGVILGSVLLMLGLIYWWINRKGDVDDF